MPKRSGIIFVIAGAVLILSALLLFLFNDCEGRRAGQEAEILLADVRSAIANEGSSAAQSAGGEILTNDNAMSDESLSSEMPVLEIDGYGYIGYLSIPDLEIELPIMAEWDYNRLKIAPCRHFGSTGTDDLVIAAHNYRTHFGSLSRLEKGAEVTFTDMDGVENYYVLAKAPETMAADAVEEVQNSGYDLVLYTCTLGGGARVVAFFERSEEVVGKG